MFEVCTMAQERKEKRSILGILDCIEDIVGGSMFFIMIMLLAKINFIV